MVHEKRGYDFLSFAGHQLADGVIEALRNSNNGVHMAMIDAEAMKNAEHVAIRFEKKIRNRL